MRSHRVAAVALFGVAAAAGCVPHGHPPTPSTLVAATPPTQPTPPPVTTPGVAWAVVLPTGGDDTTTLQAAVDRHTHIIIVGNLHIAGVVHITRPVELRWR